jgi:hypothetical protein
MLAAGVSPAVGGCRRVVARDVAQPQPAPHAPLSARRAAGIAGGMALPRAARRRASAAAKPAAGRSAAPAVFATAAAPKAAGAAAFPRGTSWEVHKCAPRPPRVRPARAARRTRRHATPWSAISVRLTRRFALRPRFGGTCVGSPERIKNAAKLMIDMAVQQKMVVVSAMGTPGKGIPKARSPQPARPHGAGACQPRRGAVLRCAACPGWRCARAMRREQPRGACGCFASHARAHGPPGARGGKRVMLAACGRSGASRFGLCSRGGCTAHPKPSSPSAYSTLTLRAAATQVTDMLLNMIALATSHDEAYKKEARTPFYRTRLSPWIHPCCAAKLTLLLSLTHFSWRRCM